VTKSAASEPSAPAVPEVDLATRRAGESLEAKVAEARAAGQRPTFWHKLLLGNDAISSWEKGLIGEQHVGDSLEKLLGEDSPWTVVHSLPIGARGADIDHVVVGPGGVFTLNTKRHRGAKVWVKGDTVLVNGQRQPYVRNSRHEASRVGKVLTQVCGFDVKVRGVVVLDDVAQWDVKEQPDDVRVVSRRMLRLWLRTRKRVFTDEQTAEVGAAVRRGSTWGIT